MTSEELQAMRERGESRSRPLPEGQEPDLSDPDNPDCTAAIRALATRSTSIKGRLINATLYDLDYAAWLEQQASLLKTGCLADLDLQHLTEELELKLGNERREIYQRMRVLIGHLLKWKYQPEQRSGSWEGTIRVQRKDLHKLLKNSPSLKRFVEPEAIEAYADAIELVSYEMKIQESIFPAERPFSIENILDKNFWPD